jgi:hypothetical protein
MTTDKNNYDVSFPQNGKWYRVVFVNKVMTEFFVSYDPYVPEVEMNWVPCTKEDIGNL